MIYLSQIGNVLTHISFFPSFAVLSRNLKTRFSELIVSVQSLIASILYHMCAMFNGIGCPLPLITHQLLDHYSAESLIISRAILFVGFPHIYQKVFIQILFIIGLLYYKIFTDTVWYTVIVIIPSLLIGFPRVRHKLKYRWALPTIVLSASGFVCYFLDDGTRPFLHYLWHIFIGLGDYCFLKMTVLIDKEEGEGDGEKETDESFL